MTGAVRNASIVSIFWAIAGIGLAHAIYGDKSGAWARSRSFFRHSRPDGDHWSASSFPIMLFFAFAIMMARAKDLRNAARSMAEVALRLAEPETIASERIMSVGQAVSP